MEGGIEKQVLHPGRGALPCFTDGGKAIFHYKVLKCDNEEKSIDDTKKYGRPMELVLGKKFKIECWESCLRTMQEAEVAEFTVPVAQLTGFAPAAKQLRDHFLNKPTDQRHHGCAMMTCEHGLGYDDLDELVLDPQPLKFVFELIHYEPASEQTDSSQLNAEQKRQRIPLLKAEGNNLHEKKLYTEAARKYSEAVKLLDELLLSEKSNDVEWSALWEERTPILLNLCQCHLLLKDFQAVITATNDFLEKDPNNVKALFKRAKAHCGAGNFGEARNDYEKVKMHDAKLSGLVTRELHAVDEEERKKELEDRARYRAVLRANAKQFESKDSAESHGTEGKPREQAAAAQ